MTYSYHDNGSYLTVFHTSAAAKKFGTANVTRLVGCVFSSEYSAMKTQLLQLHQRFVGALHGELRYDIPNSDGIPHDKEAREQLEKAIDALQVRIAQAEQDILKHGDHYRHRVNNFRLADIKSVTL